MEGVGGAELAPVKCTSSSRREKGCLLEGLALAEDEEQGGGEELECGVRRAD